MGKSAFSAVAVPTTAFICVVILGSSTGNAQEKSKVEKALSYKPVQRTVEYDIPAKQDVESCRLEKAIDKFKKPGFVVYDSSGRLLRLFLDINGDNNLDSWSYYKDGIEVYRDVDSDFDGRADEFHWLGSAGTRRGKDMDKNGTVDRWELLSASELAEEVFHAVRTSDAARFSMLLVSPSELESLNLGEVASKLVNVRIGEASADFDSFVKGQKQISNQTEWTQFGSTRPGLVPKGHDGLGQDLLIHDHAAAVFENGGKFGQISLGTIVEVTPNNWRLVELPQMVEEGQVVQNGGLFYSNSVAGDVPSQIADSAASPEATEMIKLFEEYDALEKLLLKATGEVEVAKLEEQRAELLMKLAMASTELEEKQNWIRQMADTVTSAYQSNKFPAGIDFLQKQISKINSAELSDQIPYLEWRIIYARFSVGHQNEDRRDRTKANESYISDLAQFAEKYPNSSFTADAMFQLGLNSEVTERDDLDQAVEWYDKCRKSFPNTIFGKKATGALSRLTSQGKAIDLAGSTLNGQAFDLQSSQFRGKIVVVHYWETWCESCIEGFEELQRLGAKYEDKIQIVGANLDQDAAKVKEFLSKNRSVNWPQLHSPGGVDKSPLAIQLGIATLPMTILVDQRGNLVESNIPVDELDREIQRLLRQDTGQASRPGTKR